MCGCGGFSGRCKSGGSSFVGWRGDCHVAPAVDDLAAAGDVGVFAAVGPVLPEQFADCAGAASAAADGFAEGGTVEPFAQKEAEAWLRQPVDGLRAVHGLCAQSQPGGGQAGAVAVDAVYHAEVEQRAIPGISCLQLVEGGCVDKLLPLVTEQAAFLSMHEEELIDGVGGADLDEGAGQIGGGGGIIFEDEDAVVATVGAEEPQQEFGVFFSQPVDCGHCPLGQIDAVDVAYVFQEDDQRQGFAGGGREVVEQLCGC